MQLLGRSWRTLRRTPLDASTKRRPPKHRTAIETASGWGRFRRVSAPPSAFRCVVRAFLFCRMAPLAARDWR
eukprot:15448424-Alexandrium_andersonii.AAC.1